DRLPGPDVAQLDRARLIERDRAEPYGFGDERSQEQKREHPGRSHWRSPSRHDSVESVRQLRGVDTISIAGASGLQPEMPRGGTRATLSAAPIGIRKRTDTATLRHGKIRRNNCSRTAQRM